MNDEEIKERAEEEYNRLYDLLREAGVAEKRILVIEPIIQNTAWMKIKLDDAQKTIKDSQIVISYDNGGGQKGIRENPLFKGYEALWKAYMQGMSVILDRLPVESTEVKKEEMEKPRNMLELVRERKRA